MPLLQGRLSGCALAGQLSSRQRADVNARGAPWGRDTAQSPAVTPRVTTAWQPTDTGQVALWVRGDFGVGGTYWNDASGRDLRAYQPFGALYEPALDGAAINGKPCARFDGQTYYILPRLPIGDTGAASYAYTTIVVYKLDSGTLGSSGFSVVLYAMDDEGYSHAYLLSDAGTGYEPFAMKARYNAPAISVGFGTADLYDTNGHAVVITYDGVSSTSASSYTATANATAQTVVTDGAFSDISEGSIGGEGVYLTAGLTGVVAEVLVFIGALSAGDRTALDAYLIDRYALGAAPDVPVDGAATCRGVSAASIAADHPIVGASTGRGVSAASIAADHPIAGAATATGASSATIAADHPVAGASTAQGLCAADLAADHPIAGAATCATAALADIAATHPLDGASTAATASAADLGALHPVDGAASASGSSSADVAADHPIDGAATCQTLSAAEIGSGIEIAGAATCVTSAAADIAALHPIDGAATAVATSAAELGQGQPIAGASTARGVSSATIAADHPIAGAAACSSTSAAGLAAEHPIDGASTCATLASAEIGIGLTLEGAATCRTLATCSLVVTPPAVISALSAVVPSAVRLVARTPASTSLSAVVPTSLRLRATA